MTEPVRITRLRVLLLSLPEPAYIIAAAAGIHPSTLAAYAKGKKPIKADHLISLCDVLNVEPEQVLGWAEIKFSPEELGQGA